MEIPYRRYEVGFQYATGTRPFGVPRSAAGSRTTMTWAEGVVAQAQGMGKIVLPEMPHHRRPTLLHRQAPPTAAQTAAPATLDVAPSVPAKAGRAPGPGAKAEGAGGAQAADSRRAEPRRGIDHAAAEQLGGSLWQAPTARAASGASAPPTALLTPASASQPAVAAAGDSQVPPPRGRGIRAGLEQASGDAEAAAEQPPPSTETAGAGGPAAFPSDSSASAGGPPRPSAAPQPPWLPGPPAPRVVRIGGALYCGEADARGRPHGFGAMLLPDGACHRGAFVAGRAHGPGEYSTLAGVAVRGRWEASRRAGRFEVVDAAGHAWLEDYDGQGRKASRAPAPGERRLPALHCARCGGSYHETFDHAHACRCHRGHWTPAADGSEGEGRWQCCGSQQASDQGCDLAPHRGA